MSWKSLCASIFFITFFFLSFSNFFVWDTCVTSGTVSGTIFKLMQCQGLQYMQGRRMAIFVSDFLGSCHRFNWNLLTLSDAQVNPRNCGKPSDTQFLYVKIDLRCCHNLAPAPSVCFLDVTSPRTAILHIL